MKHIMSPRCRATSTFTRPMVCGFLAVALSASLTPLFPQAAFSVEREEIDGLQAQADLIFDNIDALQTDLNNAQAEYDAALAAHDAAEAAKTEAQNRLTSAEERMRDVQAQLSRRARQLYKNGGTYGNYLEVSLGASSFSDMVSYWHLANSLFASDAKLIQESRDLQAEAQAARDDFEAQRQEAETQMANAEALREQIAAKQAALVEEASKITEDIANLEAQYELEQEEARRAAEEAERARQEAEAKAKAEAEARAKAEEEARAAASSATQAGASESGGYSGSAGASVDSGYGTFANPCPGASTSSGWGWRDFDNSFHKGTDMAAPMGTPVYAAESGTVIYATNDGGYNGGAGNWVVIAHGNGLVTKYMHNSAVYVMAGQSVERGQNIAAVGSTGQSSGPHLHFQVEVNGVAVCPYDYL